MFQDFMGYEQYKLGRIRTRVCISFKCLQCPMSPTLLLLLTMAMQLGTRSTIRAHDKAKMKIQQGTEMGTPNLLRENTPVIHAQGDSTAIRDGIRRGWISTIG